MHRIFTMNDTKKRIENAVKKYQQKNMPKTTTKRKNSSPEKQVEKDVMAYLESAGCFCTVVESKAVYSQAAGRYLHGQASIGCPDILGICQHIGGFALELKAPGKRKNLSIGQYLFLKAWIERLGFAVVVDSKQYLADAWEHSLKLSQETRREYLLSILPVPKEVLFHSQNAPLFSD